jgi:DNA-binding NarL/FixJ family response regulator
MLCDVGHRAIGVMLDIKSTRSQPSRLVALAADDDEFFRVALRTILVSQLGFAEVIETASLDEALEKLSERQDVTMALFDLQMPGMESAESLRVVRENFMDIRVVVVSSSSQRSDIITALDAGAHGYVPKSLGVRELKDALAMVLQGGIYVPPSLADVTTVPSDRPVGPPSARERPPTASLTPRQRQVLELLIQGKSNKEMARALNLGEGTVKIHMAALFRALGVTSRAGAAAAGARLMYDHS